MWHTYGQKRSSAAILLFMIGLLSQTQINIGGKLGISEFCMVACAPLVFARKYLLFRNDKVLYFFWLIFFWLTGAVFVDIYTKNYIPFMMRGIAVPITVFANCVCIYVLLRENLDNLKWLLLGSAFSGVISIFIFQAGVAGDVASEFGMEAGVERIVGYKLFWVNQVTVWLTLPIMGWYLKIPKVYSLCAMLFICIFDIMTGGRSAFLGATFALVLICMGGKSRESMLRIRRHIVAMSIIALMVMIASKYVYKYVIDQGYMTEAEEKKYERQTAAGSGLLDLLMAGRSETFIGVMAALDKPLTGHGSVAIDNHGYVLDFFSEHGSLAEYLHLEESRQKFGARIIPAHSHIVNYWMWHGVFALIFWLSIFYLAIRTLLLRMHVYPNWYGYFAVTIPPFLWDLFFSPFGLRVLKCTMFVAFLLVAKLERCQNRGVASII